MDRSKPESKPSTSKAPPPGSKSRFPTVKEFCAQLADKLADPPAPVEVDSDTKILSPVSSTASDWKFECNTVPLDTYACNNGRDEVDPEEAAAAEIRNNNIGASIISALGFTSPHLQQISGLAFLETPEDEDLKPTHSVEYFREHPSAQAQLAPNPLRLPHEDLKNILAGFTNMFLAHEVSVNEDFRLERFIPKQDTIEARVQAQMKRAFWDIFDENIKAKPPNYSHALTIFKEIKQGILSLLLPHNRNLRQRITQSLDIGLIRNQIKNNAFDPTDFKSYTDYVIEVLSQICCPSRDPDVNALRDLHSATRIFKGIFETLDKMKLDMANFLVLESRPAIIQHCVQYEKHKFADFLELEYRLHDDGLKGTRLWLFRHKIENRETKVIIAKAFGEIINYNHEFPWPETLSLDAGRLQDLNLQTRRLAIIGASVLSVGTVYQVMFGGTLITELRDKCKKHMKLLLTIDDMKNDEKLNEGMFRLAEEGCSLCNEFVKNQLMRDINASEKDSIRKCVLEVNTTDHKIRILLLRRIMDYVGEVTLAQYAYPVQMPAGLTVIHYEVSGTIAQFYRIIMHNRRVYGDLYRGICKGRVPTPKYPEELNGEWDPDFCILLRTLRSRHIDNELHQRMRDEEIQRVKEAQSHLPDTE